MMRLTLGRGLILRPLLASIGLAFLLLTGCKDTDFRPEAVGPEGQLTVIMDSVRWKGPVGDAVRDHIGTYIETLPAPEPAFDIRQYDLTSQRQFDQLKKFKNIVFVAPLSDTTNEATFIKSILSEDARQAILDGGSAVVPRTDVWRRGQQVVYVTAADPEALQATLAADGSNIRYVFNEITRRRTYREMFDRGRQQDVEEELMAGHEFAVNVQHDYLIAIDTTNFVWLRRILSDTWRSLFVYYEENANPARLTPEWVYATRDSLTRRYVQGNLGDWVEIDQRRPLVTEEVNFLDRYALETRGLWQMVGMENGEKIQAGMGGPFLTYAFYDQPSGRLYLIDGMVFAPNYEKREFLRQMEVISYTFVTRQEREQQQVAANR